jgi:replication factor A1
MLFGCGEGFYLTDEKRCPMSIDDDSIDDILDAISDVSERDVSREDVEKELRRFLEYGVPLDHAKETLIKKFVSSERALVADLRPDLGSVNLLCRVVNVNPKDVTVRGEIRRIFYGIVGDESGTVPFTAWKDFEIEKGDVVEISNAYTREWQGDVRLNFGDRTKVEKTDESRLPGSSFEPKEYKIRDLRSGLGPVEVTARVLEMSGREVEVDGEKKKVFSGVVGDDTGKAQFTSWHDFRLKKGDVVRICGGYVKCWKGIPQLIFDDKAVVEKVDSDRVLMEDIRTQRLPLHELVEKRGALDVEVEGTVIKIQEGSGLVERCPDCNRVLQRGKCGVHGDVEGVADLRIKLVIDDGTGAVGGVIARDLTESLLGKSFDELKELEKSYDGAMVEEINNALFARRIILRGNALGDEFGTTIIVKDARLVDVDVRAESERLSEELEELL